MGIFQHEIELLAAKYDKDMALADLAWSKDPEDLLQGEYLYDYWAKQAAENKALLKGKSGPGFGDSGGFFLLNKSGRQTNIRKIS